MSSPTLVTTHKSAGPAERVVLDRTSPYWGEHRSRYYFAAQHAPGARVLDIACGAGFGMVMLREAGARAVAGADIDIDAVAQARRDYGGPGRSFLTADGTRLPFADGAFDLVTSFETLEHIPDDGAFLQELGRVLAPDGLLILSTPNRAYTEMNGLKSVNPYHVREYTAPELRDLLGRYFRSVELVGQRLSPEYRISPFHADHVRMPMRGMARLALLWWKLQNRLPFELKDRLSRRFAGHPFYPEEEHYLFTEEQMSTAPVLVARCRIS